MKIRSILSVLVVACFAIPVMAQEYPKAEVFGAFSVLHIRDSGDKVTPLGWQASVAGNLNKSVGIVADFGGQYKTISGTKLKVYEYLFGPRFSVRRDNATVFAHALYGGHHFSAGNQSGNGFTMGYGGGVDVKAGKNVS